jgi:hypothetical protein
VKFREMYWYLKNLHNETISRNNLYEISRNFAKESTTKFRGISRNFAKLKSLSSLFRVSRNKKILFRDHPRDMFKHFPFLRRKPTSLKSLSIIPVYKPKYDVLLSVAECLGPAADGQKMHPLRTAYYCIAD